MSLGKVKLQGTLRVSVKLKVCVRAHVGKHTDCWNALLLYADLKKHRQVIQSLSKCHSKSSKFNRLRLILHFKEQSLSLDPSCALHRTNCKHLNFCRCLRSVHALYSTVESLYSYMTFSGTLLKAIFILHMIKCQYQSQRDHYSRLDFTAVDVYSLFSPVHIIKKNLRSH